MTPAPALRPGPAELRVSIVVLTYNRCAGVLQCLARLLALPERPHIVVVDNASADGTVFAIRQHFPTVEVVGARRNHGAAGRNLGVARVVTPYVAFCDDDTWWAPGALRHAADLLDRHPDVAAIGARVLVGEQQRLDPTCEAMARSPLPRQGLPGPALLHFMAGAVVMRTRAYRGAGGYEPRFFLGGEETLLSLDLAAQGWRACYVPEVVTHHHPSEVRESPRRRRIVTWRNRLWVAWLRLPAGLAWRESVALWRDAAQAGCRGALLRGTLAGLPWVLRRRRVVPPGVQAMHRRLREPAPDEPMALEHRPR